VTAYCRELIEACAPGGGFILEVGAAVDQARVDNMLAMENSVKATAGS
jgi:hypothetical protein